MRVYCAMLIHETSRWSPIPTDLESYREDFLYRPSDGEGEHWRGVMLDGVDWAEIAADRGHDIAWGLLAGAEPSRPTSAPAYALIRQELLDSLRAAMPVDMVALFLHGAQVADGVDDVEGDILTAVRAVVGADIPVGVVFDLHGNVSDAMIETADVALACLEYPHTDFQSRAGQLVDLLEAAVRGRIRPAMVRRRTPMLGTYYTTREPMRALIDWAKGFEGRDGVLGVSLTHGFAWSDTPDCGASVIVCHDGARDHAQALADEIAERWFALRDEIRSPRLSAADAVAQALASEAGPVVIADTADNPGGGAAGDSTYLLRALLDARAENCAIGMIWDPQAAMFAARAGVGSRLELRIGGKAGAASGAPVDLDVRVLAVRDDATQMVQGRPHPLGLAVAVQAGGLTIVINSVRQQVFDTACFDALGVAWTEMQIVVVKSQQHFHERFAPQAARILYATPPGAVNLNYPEVPFRQVPRPIYPIDLPPFTAFGRDWS